MTGDWPLLAGERVVWAEFQRTWRSVYPLRDSCACVEGYDFFVSMQHTFDTLARGGGRAIHQMGIV